MTRFWWSKFLDSLTNSGSMTHRICTLATRFTISREYSLRETRWAHHKMWKIASIHSLKRIFTQICNYSVMISKMTLKKKLWSTRSLKKMKLKTLHIPITSINPSLTKWTILHHNWETLIFNSMCNFLRNLAPKKESIMTKMISYRTNSFLIKGILVAKSSTLSIFSN